MFERRALVFKRKAERMRQARGGTSGRSRVRRRPVETRGCAQWKVSIEKKEAEVKRGGTGGRAWSSGVGRVGAGGSVTMGRQVL